MTADRKDALAAFGRASLAFERGDTGAALGGYLDVLEMGGGQGGALAVAAAARVDGLLEDAADRDAAEARLLALPPEGLPWQARMALAEITTEIARRRGDAALLAGEAGRAGCVGEATLAGLIGEMPHLDLEIAAPPPGAGGQRLEATGCRLLVPALDARPGVRVLRADLALAGGGNQLVLAFNGLAVVRVDGGPWHHHGSGAVYGPRWSATGAALAAGPHVVEVRLGTYGGATDLTLMVAPVSGEGLAASKDPTGAAIEDLVAMLAADLAGDTDGALERAGRLGERRKFALGVAAAARVALHDATRPTNIGRDAARTLYRRATAADEGLGRVWRDLAELELAEERPREATEAAERALRVAPGLWPAALTLAEAYRARGFERDADQALARAVSGQAGGAGAGGAPRSDGAGAMGTAAQAGAAPRSGGTGSAGVPRSDGAEARAGGAAPDGAGPKAAACGVVEAALRRARELDRNADEERFAARLRRCDAHADLLLDRLRMRGDLPGLERLLRLRLGTSPNPGWERAELAQLQLTRGRPAEAAAELAALAERTPLDAGLQIKLADARVAAGQRDRARAGLAGALLRFPTRSEIRSAARALGLPLPLDDFRVDGVGVIREFERVGRKYDAPAVMVLDRTVDRVFPDGARLVLTHDIVRVQSKEGIERWGEVRVPDGAELLTLRTHKPDGSVREPEEIAGKPTISAADLAVGDYLEWETMEVRDPLDAYRPGFLSERFYFQSPETPLHRSELLVVSPAGMRIDFDRRAGAPAPVEEAGPRGTGTRVTRFEVRQAPQLFAERAAVAAIDWIPSVRVSSGVTTRRWWRFLADELAGVARSSPALRKVARALSAEADGDRARLVGLLVRWVSEHIEPEADLLEPATFALARGRGNRTAVLLALARATGVPAEVVFARSLATAAPDAPVVPQELDDFADVLVRFPEARTFVDPRLRRAPLGYVPPTLEGAPVLGMGPEQPGAPGRAASRHADRRSVQMTARLGPEGDATVAVTEELTGWPAIEWAEIFDRAGKDRGKLRQEFEGQWLSQNFPGAVLGELQLELREGGAAGARLSYTFTHPELAARDGTVLRLAPTFFRAQPGHRYATEPSRRTTLLVGFDVPLELDARFILPPGARLVDAGDSGEVAAGPAGALRFSERREFRGGDPSAPEVVLRRRARLPLLRVPPADYPAFAAQLRRIDPLEQSELRVQLPAPARTPAPALPAAPTSANGGLGGPGGDATVHQ